MNDLIENNSLNLVALQKVLNNLILNLGKTVLEREDFKRSYKKYTSEQINSQNLDDDLSRFSDD